MAGEHQNRFAKARRPAPLPSPTDGCDICGCHRGREIVASERMFGMGGTFVYFECAECGCIQLRNVPADLSSYYPPGRYYSLSGERGFAAFQDHPLRARALALLSAGSLFGRRRGETAVRPSLEWVARMLEGAPSPSFTTRILDVGCGEGFLLKELAALGFRRLMGVDPYLAASGQPHPSVTLHACSLSALPAADARFDIILFHHSLEHIAEQEDTLRAVRERLAPGGVCHIEVPVAGCEAWEEYGTDWAELDAPRHLYLHTERSLRHLAARCGLQVAGVSYVGTPFQFWGSEMYRRGLPFYEEQARAYRVPESLFTPQEMAAFARRSDEANARGRGGRARFTLRVAEGATPAGAAAPGREEIKTA